MKTYILLILLTFPITIFSKENSFDTEFYIAKAVCPFECCTYRDWYSKKEVSIYEYPSANSKLIKNISKGTKVVAMTGEVQLNPAKFVFNKKHWHGYKPNDVIWILNDRGEGEYFAWDGKEIVGVVFFGPSYKMEPNQCSTDKWKPIDCSGELIEPLNSTWWVKVKLENGLSGWTNKPEYISNIDACG